MSDNQSDNQFESGWSRNDYPLEYPNGAECFPAGTLVDTPTGKVRIADLEKGQFVLSYNDGSLVPRQITRKLVYKPAKLMKVTFEDGGTPVIVTVSHSFLSARGWLAVKELRQGDDILQASATPRRIASVTSTGTTEPVFNLYTQYEHNFIADGCVAHNFTYFRALRTILHNLFLDGAPATSREVTVRV